MAEPATSAELAGSRSLLAALATALSIAAAMLVPSEVIRLLCSRTMRRRVFAPRLTRAKERGAKTSLVPSPPLWPFSWIALAWAVDDTDQTVVDEARRRRARAPALRRLLL
jgi:hypothetical protein